MIRGKSGFIECMSGELPVIIGVPHGGCLVPDHLPDRDFGCWDATTAKCVWTHNGGVKDQVRCVAFINNDLYTLELSNLVAEELHKITGRMPFMVINNLCRTKIDLNREIDEATFGVAEMETTWKEFHGFINEAKIKIGGAALYIDMHGHKHEEDWIELGYTVKTEDLNYGSINQCKSSISSLNNRTGLSLEELIRGENSFGAYLQTEGYKVVPSPAYPYPGDGKYLMGGYNVKTHGSLDGGLIDAFQIESPASLRNKDIAPTYAAALARCIWKYIRKYYDTVLP